MGEISAAILIIIAAIGFVVVLIALLLFCCAGCCAPQRGAALRAIASVIYRVQRIRRGRVGESTKHQLLLQLLQQPCHR